MDMIQTCSLSKKYKDTEAVKDLNLQVRQGELFSLLGVNGAGKTTTIRMLSCLTLPTGGDAFLNGMSILTDSARIKQLIAVSPQENAIAPHLTVRENLLLMGGVHGFSREKAEKKAAEILQAMELEPLASRRAGRLSGGWQRRLSLGMALISEPEILFLDEPSLGLDVLARRELWTQIRRLKGSVTIILTTHYMEEAEALSDRVGIMKDGTLLACGAPEELCRQTGTDRLEEAFLQIVQTAQA